MNTDEIIFVCFWGGFLLGVIEYIRAGKCR